jgi:hypothetical protein
MNAPEWLINVIENFYAWRDGEQDQRAVLFFTSVLNLQPHPSQPRKIKCTI